jgi:hypothetical protein
MDNNTLAIRKARAAVRNMLKAIDHLQDVCSQSIGYEVTQEACLCMEDIDLAAARAFRLVEKIKENREEEKK